VRSKCRLKLEVELVPTRKVFRTSISGEKKEKGTPVIVGCQKILRTVLTQLQLKPLIIMQTKQNQK